MKYFLCQLMTSQSKSKSFTYCTCFCDSYNAFRKQRDVTDIYKIEFILNFFIEIAILCFLQDVKEEDHMEYAPIAKRR